MDDHSRAVLKTIRSIPEKRVYSRGDTASLLDADFDVGMTTIRLILGMSKDEFGLALKEHAGKGGCGIVRYRNDPDGFLAAVEALGFHKSLARLVNEPVSWRDILSERLKYGRGSAIKGQKRGRTLEDFTEAIVKRVFGDVGYDTRCRFVGATGTSTEKADFAIPSKEDPAILIESKGYGATGSKQSDILGDIEKIDSQKRHDTDLLLVTDGITWQNRLNDLRKLIGLQNRGRIAGIYTQKMAAELEADLRQLRRDHSL
jgi:hypothetical protein